MTYSLKVTFFNTVEDNSTQATFFDTDQGTAEYLDLGTKAFRDTAAMMLLEPGPAYQHGDNVTLMDYDQMGKREWGPIDPDNTTFPGRTRISGTAISYDLNAVGAQDNVAAVRFDVHGQAPNPVW